jgi:hypothetical protein
LGDLDNVVKTTSETGQSMTAYLGDDDDINNIIYDAVQRLSYSRLLSENVKMKIYKTIILPVVMYGCETWSLTLRDEHILRVF